MKGCSLFVVKGGRLLLGSILRLLLGEGLYEVGMVIAIPIPITARAERRRKRDVSRE
jgi:hypothetical protein